MRVSAWLLYVVARDFLSSELKLVPLPVPPCSFLLSNLLNLLTAIVGGQRSVLRLKALKDGTRAPLFIALWRNCGQPSSQAVDAAADNKETKRSSQPQPQQQRWLPEVF